MLVKEAEIRYRTTRNPELNRQFKDSRDVFNLMQPIVDGLGEERFYVVAVDAKNRYMGHMQTSQGTVNASMVHPRDVFRFAVLSNATAIFIVHNHPTGDPAPSPEDRAVTSRIVEAGRLMGIDVLDHIIIAGECHSSFRNMGEM